MTETITRLSQLLTDKDFLLLDKNLSAFNPFAVLKLSHYEIRHSNVLAWLFNPNESHRLGTLFFKQFLYHLASDGELNSEKQEKIENIISKLESQNISEIKVYREYNVTVHRENKEKRRFIDLLLKCSLPLKKGDLIVLIENKWDAKQSLNQLDDYLEYIARQFGKNDEKNELANIIPVYLTKNEEEPKGERKSEYFHSTYYDIHEILENIMAVKTADNSEAEIFIHQYKKTLEEYLEMNEEETELAKAIYKNHKDAIDFIIKYKNTEYPLVEAGNKFLHNFEDKECKLRSVETNYDSSRGRFQFYDETLKATQDGDKKDWRKGAVCGYFFELKQDDEKDDLTGNLVFSIEIGPFEDGEKSEKRKEFVNICKNSGFKITERSNSKHQYSKIYTSTDKEIKDMSNEDELYVAMAELFTKQEVQEKIQKLHDCVDEYEERQNKSN